MRVFDTVGLFGYVGVNIVDGTVSIPTADIQSSVQNLGDGYFQVFVTQTVRAGATTAGIQFYASNPDAFNASNFDWNGTDGYLVSACPFELSPTQSPYKKTTTGPMAKPLGLINEPTRTNEATQSGNLAHSLWGVIRANKVANAAIAPDGTMTAAKLVEDTTAANTHIMSRGISTLANETKAWSVCVKAGERTACRIQVGNFTNQVSSNIVNIDLITGEWNATDVNRSYVQKLSDGWFRVGTIVTAISSDVILAPQIYLLQSLNGPTSYTGDGVSGIYMTCGQWEKDSVTSYIPSGGSPATRQADVATLYATGTNNWTLHSETGATQALGNISGGAQLTSANLNSKYVRDYKAVTVTAPPSPIEATATRGTVTNGYTVQLLNVTPGLELRDGDLISFQSGEYRQMVQIAYGGGAKAVSTQMTVNVDQPIASYIASGATVRFKQPEMNTRLVKDSFQMSKGPRPTASFQLIEVPR